MAISKQGEQIRDMFDSLNVQLAKFVDNLPETSDTGDSLNWEIVQSIDLAGNRTYELRVYGFVPSEPLADIQYSGTFERARRRRTIPGPGRGRYSTYRDI
jgi:hypothetical protein